MTIQKLIDKLEDYGYEYGFDTETNINSFIMDEFACVDYDYAKINSASEEPIYITDNFLYLEA